MHRDCSRKTHLHNLRQSALPEAEERHGHAQIPRVSHSRGRLTYASERRGVHQVWHCAIHPVSSQHPPRPERRRRNAQPARLPQPRSRSAPATSTAHEKRPTPAHELLARRQRYTIMAGTGLRLTRATIPNAPGDPTLAHTGAAGRGRDDRPAPCRRCARPPLAPARRTSLEVGATRETHGAGGCRAHKSA